MSEWRGYDHWKTSGPPDYPEDCGDNDAVREQIKESVEEETDYDGNRIFVTEEEVKEEITRKFEEGV